jgi:hypothetical protein
MVESAGQHRLELAEVQLRLFKLLANGKTNRAKAGIRT